MFNSLKNFIDLRLGSGLIVDELIDEDSFYIKTELIHVDRLIAFLKTDPDLRLNFLDHIVVIPEGSILFEQDKPCAYRMIYYLKSLKLPYRVGLVADLDTTDDIHSIAKHFLGAAWLEQDISHRFNLIIQDPL